MCTLRQGSVPLATSRSTCTMTNPPELCAAMACMVARHFGQDAQGIGGAVRAAQTAD